MRGVLHWVEVGIGSSIIIPLNWHNGMLTDSEASLRADVLSDRSLASVGTAGISSMASASHLGGGSSKHT